MLYLSYEKERLLSGGKSCRKSCSWKKEESKMKKLKKNSVFLSFGLLLMLLSACQKEDRPLAGDGFRLTVSTPKTRLALEGDHSTIEWSQSDCLFLLPRNPQSAWEYPYTLNLDPQSLSDHNTQADFVYNKDYRASGWNMGRDLPAGEYDVVYVNPKLDMMTMMSTVDSLVFSVSLISQVSQFDPTGLQSASMYSPGTLYIEQGSAEGSISLVHTSAMVGIPIQLGTNTTGQEVYLDSVKVVAANGATPFSAMMYINRDDKSKINCYSPASELKRSWQTPVLLQSGESVYAHLLVFPAVTGDVSVDVYVHLADGTLLSFDFPRPGRTLEAGYHYDVDTKVLDVH